MMKIENERLFEQKQQFVFEKRFNAFKVLKQQGFCLEGEKEFLDNMQKKNYMTREDRVDFNQKHSLFYNQLQNQYKRCLKDKKLNKCNNRRNQNTRQSVNKTKQME